jgi:photosystem II stability/assembly factor-like uncharacterized protein
MEESATRKMARALWVLLLVSLVPLGARAQWATVGPDGGDVRAIEYDPFHPDRILLGTSANQLYESTDDGNHWARATRLGAAGEHLVLDNIAFDPVQRGVIYVAAWRLDQDGGDIYRTTDAGKTWVALPGMHGKSVRAFAVGDADHKELVAGALDGVYRSLDQGDTWQRISPPNHAEIKNVESTAIDPSNPDVIYAGTWHLPWKTTDGGKTWHNIKKGIIEDSDVFSIIVDPKAPETVYASACSGIYRSDNGGELFRKAQGMPYSARRTRVLKQDPKDRDVVYAGTTEGLWKTADGGKTWKRLTGAGIIVNDLVIDPRNPQRLLVATDRSGVLASDDGGQSFTASNRGFVYRQVTALLVDRSDPGVLYAGVANDKEFGGVFVSRDGGNHWTQMALGLGGRDVFALTQTADGGLLAGTNDGIFALPPTASVWEARNRVTRDTIVRPERRVRNKVLPAVHRTITSELHARVYQMDTSGAQWFAATARGLLVSSDEGRSWALAATELGAEFIGVARAGAILAAATRKSAVFSVDAGHTWYAARVPGFVTAIYGIAVDARSGAWLATREGAFYSRDDGESWAHVLNGLPAMDLGSITVAPGGLLLATGLDDRSYYESANGGRSWRAVPVGWRVRSVAPAAGRYYAATWFDGIVSPAEAPSAMETTATGGSGR